jgi:leucyl-tRNA synthetase
MRKYDHREIEQKWQKEWEQNKTFKAEVDESKPKYYVLDMFPYPSGAGLHVGHVEGYTATDIIARYRRMLGFSVLHPMGWDSFGLPAEQYAVRTGTHPAITTQANIDTYRRQLKSLGFSYDWDREVATSDSSYYKWTQWIFTKLYERGLAYEAEVSVNYCPFLGTVLANEEVENGVSKEGGHPVIKKPFRQWMLKITEYADRLIKDLDLVDWPESVKALQINWIGKSEGALINFAVEKSSQQIQVFTTRQDTLFGANFLVLAPEHPFVDLIASPDAKQKIKEYKEKVASKGDLERTDFNKEKSGVFIGAYAINPATKLRMPIWIADYVLPNYGTGAVMGVPSHCERDFDFTEKHAMPKTCVITPQLGVEPVETGISNKEFSELVQQGKRVWEGDGVLFNSQNSELSLNGLTVAQAKEAVLNWLEKSSHGSRKIQYKLRDWLFSRQRYWGEPMPILHFEDGSMRTLAVDELPLCPPELQDYKPSEDGQSPIAKVKEWVEITDSKTNKKARRETNTMPNWAGSCWYYLRFVDPANDKEAWAKKAEKYWMPVDLYVGGVEHAVLHLLYSRFWHKVLYDLGFVTTLEPFKSLRNQGLVIARSYRNSLSHYVAPENVQEKGGKYYDKKTGEELVSHIEKMSKSKLNGVTPDEIIQEYGADSLRLYEMFMGPLEKEKVWNTDAVSGCKRFLTRAFDLVQSDKIVDVETDESKRIINKLIYKVTQDMENIQFNTVVAKMMEFMNDFTMLNAYPKSALISFTKILSPLAPHIAEEMWQLLGMKEPITYAPYPKADLNYIEDAVVTYVVQVNGKLRARLDLPKDETQEKLVELASNHPNVSKYLDGKKTQKVIFVPNKLLNLVLES